MRRLEARPILLCLAVALLAGRAAAQASQQDLGEKYALLVGVRQYDKNELRSLPYSESDVLEMARVLKDAGYRSENIIVMTQTVGAEESRFLPLGANIRKE